ncbi:hypothetical protein D8682_05100 [Buttiauxella sp. 3AFRM03]|uniref:hypothetical protein n=1 Tax=Buttiauxella sp. 3AFRM03 TaxID=2479367 RepID=UPI000EF83DFE|nr:hypothetical protein [Buttiauxella sp. 3AFRM03]AYN26429.1 hypothetical protein D8682_05100 [Buttiauxella sp. 3AFRM03]
MSRLLINENPLQVLPSLACAIGLNEAVILQQIHYWMASSRHHYQDRRWVYNSVANWQKQFPFWSEATIKRALLSLEQQGMVVSGNHNRDPRDRSKWYSINYAALGAIENTAQPVNEAFGQIDQMEQSNMTKCSEADCTNAPGQDGPMQRGNMTQPLPETTTENTQEITTEIKTPGAQADASTPAKPVKNGYSPEFESAWKAYPARQGSNPKNKAYQAWNARLHDGVTAESMLEGVKRYAAFLLTTGKSGTEFVMQGARFFGPGLEFENTWAITGSQQHKPQDNKHSGFNDRDYGTTNTPVWARGNT